MPGPGQKGIQHRMLTFKEEYDRIRWRMLFGKSKAAEPSEGEKQVIGWINLFNTLSVAYTGESAVVTSWWRHDESAHGSGEAVDFRSRHYTLSQRDHLQGQAMAAGIPILRLRDHWHGGPIATRVHERQTPDSMTGAPWE